MKITLTKADVSAIIDGGKYEKIHFEKHYRHNGGDDTIVFPRDGKNYMLTYRWFEDEGICWDPTYDADEVKLVEKVIKDWVQVESV